MSDKLENLSIEEIHKIYDLPSLDSTIISGVGKDTVVQIDYLAEGKVLTLLTMEYAWVDLNGKNIGNLVYTYQNGEKTLKLNLGPFLKVGPNILNIRIFAGDQIDEVYGHMRFAGRLRVTGQNATFIDKTYISAEPTKFFDENFRLQHP